MAGRNFSLTPRLSTFVNKQVADGRHQNASEVVREALRRYEDDVALEEAHLAEIHAAAARGMADIDQGHSVTVETPADVQALRERIRTRAQQRLNDVGNDAVGRAGRSI